MGKECNRCGEYKEYDSFYKSSSSSDGYYTLCKSCKSEYTKKKYKEDCKSEPEYVEYKECAKCNIKKHRSKFYKVKGRADGLYSYCKPCARQNKNDRYDDGVRKYQREYERRRRNNDSSYNLKCRISASIRQGAKIDSKNTYKILGISPSKLINILNSRSELNYSDSDSELDHIVPQSLANNNYEIKQLNHWSNFQLLTRQDNLTKSNLHIKKKSLNHVINNHNNPILICDIASRCKEII